MTVTVKGLFRIIPSQCASQMGAKSGEGVNLSVSVLVKRNWILSPVWCDHTLTVVEVLCSGSGLIQSCFLARIRFVRSAPGLFRSRLSSSGRIVQACPFVPLVHDHVG